MMREGLLCRDGGYLAHKMRKAKAMKSGMWKEVWYVLDADTSELVAYRSEASKVDGHKAIERIPLQGARIERQKNAQLGLEHVISIAPPAHLAAGVFLIGHAADSDLVDAWAEDLRVVASSGRRRATTMNSEASGDEGDEEMHPDEGHVMWVMTQKAGWVCRFVRLDPKKHAILYSVSPDAKAAMIKVKNHVVRCSPRSNFARVGEHFHWVLQDKKGKNVLMAFEALTHGERATWMGAVEACGAKVMDPQESPPPLVNGSLREGYLAKQGGKAKETGWKVRYHVLISYGKARELQYYESKEALAKGKKKGAVELVAGTICTVEHEPVLGQDWCFSVTPPGARRYLFAGSDFDDVEDWKRAIDDAKDAE